MRSAGENGLSSVSATAIAAVACTYFHFLLFSEFALIQLAGGKTPAAQVTMSGMVVGGIAGSLFGAWNFSAQHFARQLGWSLVAGAVIAVLSPLWASVALAWIFAAASGFALGYATVNLASGLRHWIPSHRLGAIIGLGMGTAYALANLPPIFAASPAIQAVLSAVVSGMGGLLCLRTSAPASAAHEMFSVPESDARTGAAIVLVFSALVWMDSAAFFVIQHTDTLRAVTWTGSGVLWGNAFMHFAAACLAGALIDVRRPRLVLGTAWLALALACTALSPGSPFLLEARWSYTAGVSLYSTALVWWAARPGKPWFAALLFSVAGWGASSLGIGMVQHLSLIPPLFLIASGAATALGLYGLRVRPSSRILLVAGALVSVSSLHAAPDVARGRRVYIGEGCIECHSQYLRPSVSNDVIDWGPAAPARDQEQGDPPLIGNRRLGPDLSRVGLRRSPEWNRLHLIDPRVFDAGSTMPAYAYLFTPGDPRGPDLVAYLASLGRGFEAERRREVAAWHPSTSPGQPQIDNSRGRLLWSTLCVGCHGSAGRGDGPLARVLDQRPPDFSTGRWTVIKANSKGGFSQTDLLRLIKFGIAGTPMAGHEYLSDADLRALAARVAVLHAPETNEDSHRRG